MVNANDFLGANDSEILNRAIMNRGSDGVVLIPPRSIDDTRDFWLLDSAVLLPEKTTVILQNVKIKLSDKCRDNFFRTANCGLGIDDVLPIRDIHIIGEGKCLLEGADHPRATGDSSKLLHSPCPHFPEDVCRLSDWIPKERRTVDKLEFGDIHNHSYGTDAESDRESQYGDWRGIGILFANAENFSICGLTIKEPHGWSISLEACTHGKVERIVFDAKMHKMIDGVYMNMENQDGLDIRNGCHYITVSDISGSTGDDVVALTAIATKREYIPGGSLRSTHVMHNDWTRRDPDIHDITVKNVAAYSYLCYTVRLLPAAMARIYNVTIDGVVDTQPNRSLARGGTILLGDGGRYGENKTDGMQNITVSNIVCQSNRAVWVRGFLSDSKISNVTNRNPDCNVIEVSRENGLNNVEIINAVTQSDAYHS